MAKPRTPISPPGFPLDLTQTKFYHELGLVDFSLADLKFREGLSAFSAKMRSAKKNELFFFALAREKKIGHF